VFRVFKKEPNTLLKEATAKRKAGDLENAIKLLRDAYKEIGKGSVIYPVNIFLRLPLYLQEAKRNDEAWREFNLLLRKGYPNQMSNPEIIPMDHSIIYDKMRLFLQREGKSILAVRFGIFSYLSWAIGLYRQKRDDELKTYTSKETLRNTVKKLLKKAKKENLLEKLCPVVEEQIEYLPNIDFGELAKRIDGIISK
jgi:ribosomal protein S20